MLPISINVLGNCHAAETNSSYGTYTSESTIFNLKVDRGHLSKIPN